MYLLDSLVINVHMYNNWTDLFPNHFTKILKLKAVVVSLIIKKIILLLFICLREKLINSLIVH